MKEPEVDFIGRILAAVSHEFMNVLATIRESSGLLEDLLALNNKDFPHRDKFTRNLAITRRQVARGMELGEHLNAFAHNLDQPKTEPDINVLMTQIGFLMERFAKLKQVQLAVQPAESPLPISKDPFRVQLVMSKCIDSCLKQTAAGGTITLQCRKDGPHVIFACHGEPCSHEEKAQTAPDEVTADLKETAGMLGAGLSSVSREDSRGFEIVLPCPKTA